MSPERTLADALQEEVQPDGQRADDALAEPVVGHVAKAELLPRGRPDMRVTGAAVEEHVAVRGVPLARDHLGERALAVSVDARRPEDLALPELERDLLDAELRSLAVRADALQLENASRRRRRRRPAPRPRRAGGPPAARRRPRRVRASSPNMIRTISARSSSCALERSAARSIVPASRPWRRIEISSPSDERLVELVRDEDDRLALLLEPAEHLRQLGDALRGQHRGRLVEDQDARAAPERLDDLDLLLVAEREVGRLRVRVDLDAELVGELREARSASPATSSLSRRVSPSIRFSSTVSAGISAECWCTVPIPSSSAVRGDEMTVSTPSTGSSRHPAG